MYRLMRDISLDYHWFSGHGSNPQQLGINDIETAVSFNVPLRSPETPLVITPGFALHLWDGPHSSGPLPADMPPQTFDAYIDAAWNPKLNPVLSAELEAQPGIYTDFRQSNVDSLRLKGKALLDLSYSPSVQVKAGVWYLDREQIKLLPAGGIVWTPNPADPDALRFDILFPNPRIRQRLSIGNNATWWWYVSGDYGGGTWTILREEGPKTGQVDLVDYNDIRVALGVEAKRVPGGLTGLFEVGGAFDRELAYRSLAPAAFRPDPAFFLRAGVIF
jgi:hypothetical protein